jgi:DNA polymerase III subunit alpha
MDIELLAEHSEGIIATSGCLGGLVPQLLGPDAVTEEGNNTVRDFDAALAAAPGTRTSSARTTSSSRSRTTASRAQQRVMGDLLDIAKRIGAPLLATNDAHYTRREEHDLHDVLLCIQTGSLRNEPGRFVSKGRSST